jgi:hypothetical protein
MDVFIKEDGETILSMAKVNKPGKMAATTKANFMRGLSMEKAFINGQIKTITKANGKITNFTVKEH